MLQGQDTNAALGTRNPRSDENTIGNHGIKAQDERGSELITLLRTHNLKVASTFFEHDNYTTWSSFLHCKSHQLDHWITNKLHLIHDTQVTSLGVDSDHNAVKIKVVLKAKKIKRKTTKKVVCHQMLQNKNIKEEYNARTKKYLTKEMETEKGKPTWTLLASTMKKALAYTVTIEKN